MAALVSHLYAQHDRAALLEGRQATREPRWIKWSILTVALGFFGVFLLLPLAVALWRTSNGLKFEPIDIGLAFALAPQFLSFWPSMTDWKIAVRSWPYLLLCAAGWWLATHGTDWFSS